MCISFPQDSESFTAIFVAELTEHRFELTKYINSETPASNGSRATVKPPDESLSFASENFTVTVDPGGDSS
jgi:hypothetical protein